MKHKLLFELGRGGTATAYLAVSYGPAGFSKLAVIKRLHHDLASDPRAVEMFTAEARVTALLNHPNIVQVHEIVLDGDEYVIEMEYLDGQSLEAIVRRGATAGGIPLSLGLWILGQVLAGLHYAHELRASDGTPLAVVHRDVSPHNVIVTYEGAVKVLDFGIAKVSDSVVRTETGLIKGKVAYMAPEQATRGAIDRRADVFAVGVILWQLVTGKRLWAQLSDFEIFKRLSTGEIPSPRSVQKDVSPALEAMCQRALAPKPEDRFATAAEFQTSIDEYLETTNPRIGPRLLAKYVSELFATTRPATRARIDERLAKIAITRESSPELDDPDAIEPLTVNEPSVRVIANTFTKATVTGPAKHESHTLSPAARRRLILVAVVATVFAGVTALAWIGGHRSAERASAVVAPAAVADALPACRASVDCGANDAGARVCRAGRCVALASVDCHVVAAPGDVTNDATVWFGVMFPLKGPNADPNDVRAAELAREDFMAQTSGLPPASGVGPSRPLGLIVCDDSVDPARAAKHLAEVARVPAVIGFDNSKEVIDLARSVFLPNGVLVLVTTNPSPFIAAIPQPEGPRLVWRATVNAAHEAQQMASFVTDFFEPRIRERFGTQPKTPIRILLARTDNSVGLGVSSALFTSLRFNGKSVMENGASFKEIVLPPKTENPSDFVASVDALIAFKPHLVLVYAARRDLTRAFYAQIEARWPRAETTRPYYFIKDYPHREDFLSFLSGDAALRHRVFGIMPPVNTPTNVKLVMHYNERAPTHVSLPESPSEPYDGVYVLAYAAFAAGDGPLTGASLSRAIARLVPPGPRVEVGPADVFDGFRVLRAGGNIDLVGAGTTLDFDLATGEPTSDLVLLCAHPASGGGALRFDESGLRFDAHEKRIVGRIDCP